ncbi:MAG: class I SAM-dependent methyltransferase [Desulfovibrio sp.]|jgi:SAM-dependent methyltransferase|nr:class I SAM-dependent methyltransferase [Desulfovibrio sp.]
MSFMQYLRANLPLGHDLGISGEDVKRLVHDSGAEPWHIHAITRRKFRRHACVACDWLASALPRDAAIFEIACGSGANLLWLAKKGFSRLYGIDIAPQATQLSRALARLQGIALNVWEDDALSPSFEKPQAGKPDIPFVFDGILSLTWLYHVPGADLGGFLRTWKPWLKQGGIIVFEMITRSYNSVLNNQYHSDDWELPVSRRRPSEYWMRLDKTEVQRTAEKCGYTHLRSIRLMTLITGKPEREVHMLRRVQDE